MKYGRERTQPVIDLVSRIELNTPERIIDIGCGPGNSTAVLAGRWPKSRITGLDSSPAMIERARESGIEADWITADASTAQFPGTWDLIFSNAAYQWIPRQSELFHKLKANLKPGGIMAAQIPLFREMPMSRIIVEVGLQSRWGFSPQNEHYPTHSREEYYDILSGLFEHVEMWVTSYIHVMESHEAILEMMKSTALKPFLAQLDHEKERGDYEREILEGIKRDYPARGNNKVLYPFKRLFFIAK
ncbi:MAG: methyltransferase domain-containing protein [Spirochaetales bacterium]|nr:methyltransferase domain-containing protein [Spirochaetales bacterium]